MQPTNKNPLDQIEPYLRRKWLIILFAILGAAAGVAVALYMPKMYMSSTMILVEAQQVSEKYVEATERTPFQQRLNTIKQQIMSRTNLEKIIDDYKLYADNPRLTRDDAIENMREDIEVNILGSRARGGDAFSISYISKNPRMAMEVTNTLSSMFIEENLKLREQSVEGTSDFISREVERAREVLAKQEETLKKFKDEHMGALPAQLDTNLRTLDRLQLELQSVHESLRSTMGRKVLLEKSMSEEREAAIVPSGQPSTLTERLDGMKRELSQLLTQYTENYPDVVILKSRISEAEDKLALQAEEADSLEPVKAATTAAAPRGKAINKELKVDLFLVKSDIDKLKAREKKILQDMKAYEQRVEETSANEQKLADITRDYNISYRNYEALLGKKLNAELAENLEKRQKGERFRIIDPAYLPEKPFKPNRAKIALIGLAGGVGLGVGLVFLLEMLNPAIRRPEELEEMLSVQVLTTIPLFSSRPPKVKKKREEKELKLVKGGKS